ncbi:8-demethyl-8-(2, 3-dimethoxy-alpha-L-rhamnosyl)-tetracenomycin-C 4'-O-methyltransferase [Methylacidimicrobium cyclopophantes]|uniref:8-demethyl-8-(2, 3-dimethoxy-alpha-L-rhamnosyl)-tetracenomycin-C 4'-O-methyltransferase n=1 Tax=Methylacidimicrobium cyclopophantes TaxID=1041766 RepID=A0A5E6MBQ4_9BACT|nr:TylF/MycF/NovP-related O-methyltransferase [Methylacidimicrobium cyclopophantes]VVM06962.1 8-demethyl-8-(2, 3-dimethoxy-alpha-L-rhamnosyl)-tetracenomycin-C 4'-O-methyltransferase [Methylacidimicrobium cyclopophantes]
MVDRPASFVAAVRQEGHGAALNGARVGCGRRLLLADRCPYDGRGKRVKNFRVWLETILAEGVEGDLIEAGVWRGGAAIFMKAILSAHGDRERRLFVADSFAGLPKGRPQEREDAELGVKNRAAANFLAVCEEEIRDNFGRYDLLDDKVIFLKGSFYETVPKAPIGKLALPRADGDMFRSMMESVSENLCVGHNQSRRRRKWK